MFCSLLLIPLAVLVFVFAFPIQRRISKWVTLSEVDARAVVVTCWLAGVVWLVAAIWLLVFGI